MYLNEYTLVQLVKERLADRREEAARHLMVAGLGGRTPLSPRILLGRALIRMGDLLLGRSGDIARLSASP